MSINMLSCSFSSSSFSMRRVTSSALWYSILSRISLRITCKVLTLYEVILSLVSSVDVTPISFLRVSSASFFCFSIASCLLAVSRHWPRATAAADFRASISFLSVTTSLVSSSGASAKGLNITSSSSLAISLIKQISRLLFSHSSSSSHIVSSSPKLASFFLISSLLDKELPCPHSISSFLFFFCSSEPTTLINLVTRESSWLVMFCCISVWWLVEVLLYLYLDNLTLSLHGLHSSLSSVRFCITGRLVLLGKAGTLSLPPTRDPNLVDSDLIRLPT